jgi:hypothetical protein
MEKEREDETGGLDMLTKVGPHSVLEVQDCKEGARDWRD